MVIMRKLQSGPLADRARRASREIALAAIVTLVAAACIVAGLSGSGPETAAVSDRQEVTGSQPN
jgi:hypothetical protein